jgi:Ca-activated chloride channel family protein
MNETTAFTLACCDGRSQPPVLRDVSAAARLDGTLFELVLRQTYRNTGTTLLEVVYTFPLLPRGVLLSFATELNGARMVGTILPRKQAEQRYEGALADGDAPVMLEAHADGLHTANIGNLKPGDEIVVEVRMAQVVTLEQGRLRLAIPATIAPRYGDPAASGLQPQQAPVASMAADYPLALTLHVSGALADAAIACPTHRVVSRRTEAGLEIALAPEARLDRDVVLVVTPTSAADAVVTQAHDARSPEAPTTLLATLPIPAAPQRDSIALKLLVDCSGSMGGDSMASARRALNGIAALLTPADAVSLTRFGSTVEHASPLTHCTPAVVNRLVQHVARTDANLGGTEMEAALAAVFAIASDAPPRAPDVRMRRLAQHAPGGGTGDVLLITDGEVWSVDAIIETARRAAQRVFVIGVGASPAEGVLRRLATATGGACEFATPGEALEAAAQRMLARIRQQAWTNLRVDWGGEAAWQDELPLCAFAGDTLDVFGALRASADAGAPVRLLARTSEGVDIPLATASTRTTTADDALPRVAAARRLVDLPPEAATALAVRYQLMSPHTNCVLVHERAAGDKATDEAQLHRVEGMLAAGWGATGSVLASADLADMMSPVMAAAPAGGAFAKRAAPPRLRKAAAPLAEPAMLRESEAERSSASTLGRIDLVAPQAGGMAPESAKPAKPRPLSPLWELAQAIADHLRQRGSVKALEDRCRSLGVHAQVAAALREVVALGIGESAAWTLLARWLDERFGAAVAATFPESALLRAARIDAALATRAFAAFDRTLGALPHARDWPAMLA